MRKHIKLICAMLIAAVLLASSGCAHGASPAAQSPADTAADAITIAEPQMPTETVMGYVSTEVETPEWVESFKCSAPVGDWFHTAAYTTDGGIAVASYDTLNDAWQRYDLGTEPAICPTAEFFSAAEGSFWVVLRESYMDAEISAGDHSRALNYYLVYIDAETGEQTCSYLAWDEHQPYYMALIALDKNRALLSDGETTYLLDPMAEVIDTPPLEILGGGLHVYVDGEMYVGTYDGVAHLDKAALQYTDTVSKMKDQPVYGSCLGRFLTTKDSTLYSVSLSDEETELFSWMDVSLSYSRLYGWDGLENSTGDIFHMTDRITKVSRAPVPVKKPLVLACFGDSSVQNNSAIHSYICSDKLMDAILRFNNSDPEYRVEVRPYICNDENERNRMLMSIATGSDIDLIDTSLLPGGAVDRQLLVDLLPYIDADDTLSRDDFIPTLLSSMMNNGGLYEYVDKYTILTMYTHPEFAGDDTWTASSVEQLIRENPELKIPSLPENMKLLFSWAATAEFIDRANGTCSFDSPAFVSWLSLLKQMTGSAVEYARGSALCCISYDFVWDIGLRTHMTMRGDYSVVGFPDAAGTGSYFLKLGKPGVSGSSGYLSEELDISTGGESTSVGILASGSGRDGAWRFLRTFIGSEEEPSIRKGIPVLKETFEQAMQAELNRDTSGENLPYPYFSEEDAEILRGIVYGTDKVVCTDEAVIDIITWAVTPYLEGKGTAEDAAREIQSRMSIYLAEQA